MSETRGPFDAAIDVLEAIVMEHEFYDGWKDNINDWKTAIHVLEAAGKVDKDMALEAEFFWPHNVQVGREFGPCRKAIRTLLASLPDKEKP